MQSSSPLEPEEPLLESPGKSKRKAQIPSSLEEIQLAVYSLYPENSMFQEDPTKSKGSDTISSQGLAQGNLSTIG